MTPNEDTLINEVTRTISVAVLIYLTGIVTAASISALGFGINPLFGIFIPMGIVFVAFTLYHYREYE